MNLTNITLYPENLSPEEEKYLLKVLDDFPLKGRANTKAAMKIGVAHLGKIGERISLSPFDSSSRARFSFELDNLPTYYFPEYMFEDGNFAVLIITETSNCIKGTCPVTRTYYISPVSLEKNR